MEAKALIRCLLVKEMRGRVGKGRGKGGNVAFIMGECFRTQMNLNNA